MSAFFSYDDTMIVTPTSIINIPATCTTCSVTTCAPAFNTACVCTSCSWLVPATPVTPAPAGNSHSIVICANTGAARSGCVCYVSVCGGNCAVTLSQLAGITGEYINYTVGHCEGILCPALTAGDCFCLNFCVCLCKSAVLGLGCIQLLYNCVSVCCACQPTNANAYNCSAVWGPVFVKASCPTSACLIAHNAATGGKAALCSYTLTLVVGSYLLCSPTCVYN
jgi:hypothetical protein